MQEKSINFDEFIKGLNNPAYADLASMPEDERLDLMGRFVTETGKTVSIITDDEPGKPERYIKKILKRFPHLRIVERFKGPIPGVVTLNLGPDRQHTAN